MLTVLLLESFECLPCCYYWLQETKRYGTGVFTSGITFILVFVKINCMFKKLKWIKTCKSVWGTHIHKYIHACVRAHTHTQHSDCKNKYSQIQSTQLSVDCICDCLFCKQEHNGMSTLKIVISKFYFLPFREESWKHFLMLTNSSCV